MHTWSPVKRGMFELALVLGTGAAHLAWPLTGLSRGILVVPLVLGWFAYVVHRCRTQPDAASQLGFRWQGLLPTGVAMVLLLSLAGPLMVAYGIRQGAAIPWTTGLTLVIYPVWGLVQQLIVQGVVTNNLRRFLPAWGAVVLSATGFGLVHWNEPILVGSTFLLGLIFAPLYLRFRNLWPLGLAHGWLGTLVYTFVLMRDPLAAYLLT